MPSTLESLQSRVILFRDERDWRQFHNPKDMALSLVLEAGEVMEHFQWKSVAEAKERLVTHKEQISDELADVLYWVLLMAHDFEIDLPEALEKKLEKSALKYPIEKSKGRHTKYTEL